LGATYDRFQGDIYDGDKNVEYSGLAIDSSKGTILAEKNDILGIHRNYDV